MLVKIKYEDGELFKIARECGVAPCTIILSNNCRNEKELPSLINVPINTQSRCKVISYEK